MPGHFGMLEESNYELRNRGPNPAKCEYEEKTSRPREEKTKTRQSEQHITTPREPARGFHPAPGPSAKQLFRLGWQFKGHPRFAAMLLFTACCGRSLRGA